MAVGEAFLSAFLQVLFDRLASNEFLGLLCGRKYDDLLEKLKITVLTVTTLLNDAEEKQFYNTEVRKWLHMTKDALYDAEDILDELASEALAFKMEAEYHTSTNKVWNWSPISTPRSPSSRRVESKLMKIIERLELIAKYKNVLGLKDNVGGRLFGSRLRSPTTSLVDESCVYGRSYDKEKIIQLLVQDEPTSSKVHVVPIVGMCGIGKTTLAQLVYNDDIVDRHFDLKVWIFVSSQFDAVRVTKTMLGSLHSGKVDLDDLNLLQVCLKEKLAGKRFLLVLDDIWNKSNNDWDLLLMPLKVGKSGSKIIVTTQNTEVASSLGTVPAYHLSGLSFEDCWSLFMSQASESRIMNVNFQAIGEGIVRRCAGLPLAVKRFGVLLRSRTEEDEWKDILDRPIWDLPDDESNILQVLSLSYHHLPAHLKPCFAYCSIFPREYELDKETLVLLWMAEGFLRQPRGKKKLEAVGDEYFHELVSRSFFQETIHNRSRYIMHNLMHELAQFVSGEFCFRLEEEIEDGDKHKAFDKARHSSYVRRQREVTTRFESFSRLERLRTFLPLDSTDGIGVSYLSSKVPNDLLPKLRCLRVLSFSACRITELPDSLGNLKHLRYLNLSRTAIEGLPDSMTMLYNLQTLILTECRSLTRLPVGMGNLTSLRHLHINGSRLEEMPSQMCALKNLQTLSKFIVSRERGWGIRDLKDMLQLKGSLHISGLQNVVNFVDAMEANLKGKQELEHLVLQWSETYDRSLNDNMPQIHRNLEDLSTRGHSVTRFPSFKETMEASALESRNNVDISRNERVEMVVLEMLQPHKSIKGITVKDYEGTRFPSWIASPLFSNIILLKVTDCRKCSEIPALGQLPSLKYLILEGMDGLKRIGAEFYGNRHSPILQFPSLETLKLNRMINLEDWSSSGVEGREDFCHLKKIEILNCPKLRRFSQHFSALKEMRIKWCEELISLPCLTNTVNALGETIEFPCLLELCIWTCPKLKRMPSVFPSLKVLEINGCQELEELPKLPFIHELELKNCNEGVLESIMGLASVTYLRLNQIPTLTCLVEGFLRHLTALEELQLANLSEMITLSDNLGWQNLLHLKHLEISECPLLKELPQCLYKLSSLKELRIWRCPSLVSFPNTGFPSTLRGLEIKGCEALQFLPEWKMHSDERSHPFEYLVIEDCSSLKSLPGGTVPRTLQHIEIQNCINLDFLPEHMIQNNTCLEFLNVSGCHSVVSFPEGTFGLPVGTSSMVMNLKQLIISNCTKLKLIPEGLHNLIHLKNLEIAECPLVEAIAEYGLPTSMLQSIKISKCQSLKSLPNRLYSLTCLQELSVEGCSNLVSFPEGGLPTNLLSLSILDCEKLLPTFEWGLHGLTCLTNLTFGGCEALVSFPEDWLLPTTLSSLQLQRLPNLESLPKRLNELTSLDSLELSECDRLQTFTEEEQPRMLQNFEILGFPLTSGFV
ncbi:putative disease resistance RPP13-like protein 1 [Argentina anserina]|uniref:putative disease resistance RPP13-like protein 1 n=1 Tax=Argentina anserina TaxID=57926 RepID=UPI0021766B1F|nr:putative disease resistance RPP13-like protein 1 [Potentilla anserina]